jgi:hypothetical protein
MIETVPSREPLSDIDADRSEQMHYRARRRVRSSGASARRNTKAKEITMSATDAADVDVKM